MRVANKRRGKIAETAFRILQMVLDYLEKRLTPIVKRGPANIIFAVKRTAFQIRERNPRFNGFVQTCPQGINLAAYIRAEMGLGQAARGMATALEAAQIPFNILNFEHSNRARHGDRSWVHKECLESEYDITVLAVN